jgi:Spy/CpxP family protein refolding chaperone
MECGQESNMCQTLKFATALAVGPFLCAGSLFAQAASSPRVLTGPHGGDTFTQLNESSLEDNSLRIGQLPLEQPWFSDPGVRDELRLTDEQYEQLIESHTQASERYNSTVAGLGVNADLSDQDRNSRLQRLQNTYQNNVITRADAALNDAAQRERFRQLHWQYQGSNAFRDPFIQEKLQLSNEQLLNIARYGRNGEISSGTSGAPLDERQNNANAGLGVGAAANINASTGSIAQSNQGTISQQERIRAVRLEMMNRIHGTLTPQQQQAWSQMVGAPYDVGVNAQGPRGTVGGRADAQPNATFGATNNNGVSQPGMNSRIGNQGNGTSLFPGAGASLGGRTTNGVNRSGTAAGTSQNIGSGMNSNGPGSPPNTSYLNNGAGAGNIQPGNAPRGLVQPGVNRVGNSNPGNVNPAGGGRFGGGPPSGAQPGANPAAGPQPGANPAGGVQPNVNPATPIGAGAGGAGAGGSGTGGTGGTGASGSGTGGAGSGGAGAGRR